jgi:hypothetical protein
MIGGLFNPDVEKFIALYEALSQDRRHPSHSETSVKVRFSHPRIRNLSIVGIDQSVQRVLNRLDHVIIIQVDGYTFMIVHHGDPQAPG